jgi:putative tryptophan/tyrosine transport system substrate-binding protein
LEASQPTELDQAFAAAAHEGAGGIVVVTHGFAELYRKSIIDVAANHRTPTIYGWRDFVQEGGLISYGPNVQVMIRNAASYVDRIVRGEKPGDLPMQQPVKLELIVNLKTAKNLGLTFPQTVLVRADEVID